jgi:basic amino acid/polyamine antiporter, APA family
MSRAGEEQTVNKLKPVLGPVQLVFYGVGVIVGAGVYSVIGSAAGIAHQSLWLSFAIGAFVALLTGFAYAEMTTSFPSAGAEYQWLRHALPRFAFVSFAIGMVILMGGAAAAATVAAAFGGYLRTFVDIPIWLSASALLAACTALNIWGLRESSWANIVFTVVEIAGLIFVIEAGTATGRLFEPLLATTRDGVLPAAATVFFVYLGFEKIANMTEEVRNPGRTIPRAIFHSIAITTALYILVSLAVMCLATPNELAGSNAPLASAIENVWRGGGRVLGGIAIISTANTVLISLVAGSRLAYSMGRDNEIPRMFAALLPDRDTPWVAAISIFAMSELLVPIGNVKILAELSSLTALLAFLAVNIALIVLRYRFPDHARPFRVPFSAGRMPIIPLASIASICLLMINFDREIYLAAGGLILLSGLAYVFQRRDRSR